MGWILKPKTIRVLFAQMSQEEGIRATVDEERRLVFPAWSIKASPCLFCTNATGGRGFVQPLMRKEDWFFQRGVPHQDCSLIVLHRCYKKKKRFPFSFN